jgi:hypothetical protein
MTITEVTEEMVRVLLPNVENIELRMEYSLGDWRHEKEYVFPTKIIKRPSWRIIVRVDSYQNAHLITIMNYLTTKGFNFELHEDARVFSLVVWKVGLEAEFTDF